MGIVYDRVVSTANMGPANIAVANIAVANVAVENVIEVIAVAMEDTRIDTFLWVADRTRVFILTNLSRSEGEPNAGAYKCCDYHKYDKKH